MIKGMNMQSTTWENYDRSRTSVQSDRKRMLDISIRHPEDAILLGRPNHTRHIKNQCFKIAYDKAIITEWSIGEMGHLAFPIRDEIHATKGCERDKRWQIFWLIIQTQGQPNCMKISQMRSLKFAWLRHLSKNKSGNFSLTACRERAREEIS